jgi:hypothetical protein
VSGYLSFSSSDRMPEINNLKGGRIYFRSSVQIFQSIILGSIDSELMYITAVEACGGIHGVRMQIED